MQNDSSVTDVHEPYCNKRGVTEESLFWPIYKAALILDRLVYVRYEVVTFATQLLLHELSGHISCTHDPSLV
jgi:hypothetical protein